MNIDNMNNFTTNQIINHEPHEQEETTNNTNKEDKDSFVTIRDIRGKKKENT